jgi:hypothetical protein
VLTCKIGFELKAVICPSMLHSKEDYAEEIDRIAELYAAMAQGKITDAAHEMYGAQTGPPPEPDAGEVVGGQMEFGTGDGEESEVTAT